MIKYAIRNISEEVIGAGPYAAEGLDMGGDHIILVVGAMHPAGFNYNVFWRRRRIRLHVS